MNGNHVVGLNGFELWAYVVETAHGLRLQLSLDDWQKINLSVDQRIPIRLPQRADAWLFITNVTKLPPILWVMTRPSRVAG